jgi:germination protein M
LVLRRTLLLLALLALAGCGGAEESSPEPRGGTTATQAPPTTASEERQVLVYFLRDERLGVAARVAETSGVGAAALAALLEGPNEVERDAGFSTAVPAGTALLGLSIADGVATVDLSGAFAEGGGSASMQGRVAQVVYTLTQFPTVGRVAFRLDGQPVEAIGGEGVLVDPPVGRADFEDVTPIILVEEPTFGAEAASPLRISGTANTFEATFVAEVKGADGGLLAEQIVTATSGSGDRGTFEALIPFAGTAASLVVYAPNADDGGRLHEVEIPLARP